MLRTSEANHDIRVPGLAPEWGIVETRVRNAGKLVTQKQLLDEVWGPSYADESNYLRVHMAHLRRKLEPDTRYPRYC